MTSWAARHGVDLGTLDGDEGLSGDKTSPFERPGFLRQLARAEALGRETGQPVALLFEMVDRFTRRDLDELGWAKTEVRNRTGGRVVVWFCEVGAPDEQGKPMARLFAGFKAEAAKDENDKRKARIPGGMRLARERGVHVGRPSKLDLITPEEHVLLERWHREDGHGEEKLAVLLNDHRKVHLLADAGARRARSVSAWVIRRAMGRAVKGYSQGNSDPKENQMRAGGQDPPGKDILSSEAREA